MRMGKSEAGVLGTSENNLYGIICSKKRTSRLTKLLWVSKLYNFVAFCVAGYPMKTQGTPLWVNLSGCRAGLLANAKHQNLEV